MANKPVILTTERLKLRAVEVGDAQAIYAIFSDNEVTKYYDLESFTSLEQAESFIARMRERFEQEQGIRWAIVEQSSGNLVGTCGFNVWHSRNNSTVLGYDLNRSAWGKGYATEAVGAIVDYVFSQAFNREINRIQALTIPENVASEKVLTKLGFVEEGLLRQYGFWKNTYHNMNSFSLLASDQGR